LCLDLPYRCAAHSTALQLSKASSAALYGTAEVKARFKTSVKLR
jgi:hypothetical protein